MDYTWQRKFLALFYINLPLRYENFVNYGMKFLYSIKENPLIDNQVKRCPFPRAILPLSISSRI